MLRKRVFVIRKSPRVRDGRGSRLVGELAEPPATTAIAKPGQPDLPVWEWSLVDGGRSKRRGVAGNPQIWDLKRTFIGRENFLTLDNKIANEEIIPCVFWI